MSLQDLNQGQRKAFDDCFGFLLSEDPFFVISGPAGTGKTYLMNTISEAGMQHYHNSCALMNVEPDFHAVAFTATTNKAAEVLEVSIGKPTKTIHSFLGVKVLENYRTGKTDIAKGRDWKPKAPMILFIDECSMIDQTLLEIILETMPGSKIIFVGDHSQMAPINAKLSPVYDTVSPDNFAVLTEPVRNANSTALKDLCLQLRDTVETGIFKPMDSVAGVIDYLDDVAMPAELDQVFKIQNPSSRVLCYTNEQVNLFNEYIRSDVRNLPPEFVPGDVLVVAQAYQRGKVNFSVERELTVKRVGPTQYDDTHSGILGDEVIEYNLIDFTDPTGTSLIEDIPVARKRAPVDFTIKTYAKRKQWPAYFDLKATYLDLRDKAASTVYKAQGSTYDSVYIDLGNIGKSFDPQQVARMLYVAVSRAQTRVCFYGRLPLRYHNSEGKPLWTPEPGPDASQTSSSLETNAA